MYYGVSYYPEQKSSKELAHDISLLKESGINTVRMGEFSWCRMEPKEGMFEFGWLDSVISELGQAGIRTVVCTPTACPPVWLTDKYPDLLYMDNRKVRRPFGGRRHYCYNHEGYREYCRKIAEEIGRHYGSNPYVLGFQIDNEPAQEGTGRCACPVCQHKFQDYLKNKYGTIEAWNQRSGSVFWSQEYDAFEQIKIPANTIEKAAQNLIMDHPENPTLRLEFERFSSDSQIGFQNIQRDELKKYTAYPVTTNTTGLATNSIDYYKSTKKLDNFAFDYYPELRDKMVPSFPYAFARGIKQGAPFWILEFSSGGGHAMRGYGRRQPTPGAMKLAAVQSMVHGAEMMLHFQFRAFPAGAEQLNYSIVDLDGKPRRRYYEMQETGRELRKLEPYFKAGFDNQAAICMDYDSLWALGIKPIHQDCFNYVNYCEKLYRLLAQVGINADVVSCDHDFTKYKLVIIPCGIIMDREIKRKCIAYTEQGGNLLATFLTGVKNCDNVGCTETLPAGLSDLFGISVEEWEPVFDDTRSKISMALNNGEETYRNELWSELLSGDAEGIGFYTDDFKQGMKAVTRHRHGKGSAYYLGTGLEEAGMKKLFENIAAHSGVLRNPVSVVGNSSNVEIVRKYLAKKVYYFIFNFDRETVKVRMEEPLIDIRTDRTVKELEVEAVSYCILKK